jgi:hypothetical protein
MFDDLPSLSAPVASKLKNELERYLELPVVNVKDAISWWVTKRVDYPRLSRMALDYLTIPGMSRLLSLISYITNDSDFYSYFSGRGTCI